MKRLWYLENKKMKKKEILRKKKYTRFNFLLLDSYSIAGGRVIYHSYGVVDSKQVTYGLGISQCIGVLGGWGVAESVGIGSCYGVDWSKGISDSRGVAYSCAVFRSSGVFECFGVYECHAVSRCIFCTELTAQSNMLFNQRITDERFEEVHEKLKSFNYYPKCNKSDIGSRDMYNEDFPENLLVDVFTAWSDLPQAMREYVESLPEFDQEIFDVITGVFLKIQEDS